ncbi:MAG TPA: TaqI-like C-terminal specificity domain-containing protein [Candidatus Kapabacteria bacterium]|nr:TaqI-like C-terminal specificity domain-containing protein [Candidatus Kapabacteria bacterium]
MQTKDEALKKIKLLVQRFDEQKEFYKKSDYNETQTRRDFIDPFWKALGWDIDNENGYACLNTVFMIVPKTEASIDIKFLLAVLNSKFIANYWTENFSDLRQTFPKIKGSYLEKLPIPEIGQNQQDQYNEVKKQTSLLLKLIGELQTVTLADKKEQLENRISFTEDKINQIIYDLYELTDEERKQIETN